MPEEKYNPDTPYSNREIREKWHDISNTQQAILTQTTKTNGSVADINRWRERANGAFIASSVFMGAVVLPILGWAMYVLISLPQTVHKSVDDALSAYDIIQSNGTSNH